MTEPMIKAFSYLRTSADDGKDKAGLPVQRDACNKFAASHGFKIEQEFADDGVSGKIHMHARPQGKLLIASLLGNGVKTVICYKGTRIGRTQPAFWSFAGMCRDNGIALLDASGTNLLDSVQGGVNALLSEMDRDATVARLAAGKAQWRGTRRVEGRWPYGQHPSHEYDNERVIVARIKEEHAKGVSMYAIAKQLRTEGILTRYGKQFDAKTISNILKRGKEETK